MKTEGGRMGRGQGISGKRMARAKALWSEAAWYIRRTESDQNGRAENNGECGTG